MTFFNWTNRETWNVCFWISNDKGMYDLSRRCANYQEFVQFMHDCGSWETPDMVSWNDDNVNIDEVNESCFAEDADDFIPMDLV